MESYIVRVLRRQQTNPNTGGDRAVQLDGGMEAVDEDGGYRAFHSVDELWSILTGGDRLIQSGVIQTQGNAIKRWRSR